MTVADKLIAIADNTSAVAKAMDAARVSVEGSSVRAEGVAEFPVKVQLKNKNLICAPTLDADADKNRVLFEGSLTGSFVFSCVFDYSECQAPTAAQFSFVVDGVEIYMSRGSLEKRETTFSGTLTKITFLNWGYGVGSVGQIQLEYGTVSTDYTPQIEDFTGVGVKVFGKNLLSKDDYYYKSMELNGVTFTVNNDGSITVNGTATKTTTFYILGGGGTEVVISINQKLRKGVPYTVSDNPPGASFSTYYIQYSINNSYYSPLNSTRTFTMTSDADVLTRMYITVMAGVAVDNITFHPQIEVGTAATDFEAYKAPQTAQADSSGKVTGIVPVLPTMTVVADSGAVQVSYLPDGQVWNKYQQIIAEERQLADKLKEV